MKDKNRMEDLLIRFSIDKNDLNDSELICLKENRDYLKDSQALSESLNNLGKIAADLTPDPVRSVELKKKPVVFPSFPRLLAVSIVIIFVLIFINKEQTPVNLNNPADIKLIYQEIEKDRKFMTEIDKLIDSSALSEVFPDIGEAEINYDFSDEFMESIVSI